MTRYLVPLSLVLFTVGCDSSGTDTSGTGDTADTGTTDTSETGDTDTDTSDTGDTDTGDTDTADTSETGTADGYAISGIAYEFGAKNPAVAGLCVAALDPTPALTGDPPIVLATGLVAEGGTFVVSGITERPSLGLVMLVKDCTAESVYPTGTGFKSATIQAIADGDTLEDTTIFSINASMRDALVDGLSTAGGSWDPVAEGILLGSVVDSSHKPLAGATVTGAGATTFYMDGDSTDGMFTIGNAANTATVAEGGAVWAIADAPITMYSAKLDTYTFPGITGGSLSGMALFVQFVAN